MIYLYLAAGGIAGTLMRFWISGSLGAGAVGRIPWGTLLANVMGSLLLGIVVALAERGAMSPETRVMLTAGFCGALTTFSTMSYETVWLVQEGAWPRAAAYALGGLALGIGGVVLGLQAGRLFGA